MRANPIGVSLKLRLVQESFAFNFETVQACADQDKILRGGPPSDQGWSNKFYHCKTHILENRGGTEPPIPPPLDPPMSGVRNILS